MFSHIKAIFTQQLYQFNLDFRLLFSQCLFESLTFLETFVIPIPSSRLSFFDISRCEKFKKILQYSFGLDDCESKVKYKEI